MHVNLKALIWVVVIAFFVGMWTSGGGGRGPVPNPFAPQPERPVLSAITRVAKKLMWVAVFLEPVPPDCPPCESVQTEIGSDGYAILDNGRGW
jgi:hypothetical protein